MKNKKNMSSNEISKKLKQVYEAFIQSPTDSNLSIFIRLAEAYKEEWIVELAKGNKSADSKKSANSKMFDKKNITKEISNKSSAMSEEPLDVRTFMQLYGRREREKSKFSLNKAITKNEIGRAESRSGSMKVITSHIYVPPFEETQERELGFSQHSFRGQRYHKENDKFFNRRWYIESEIIEADGEMGTKESWQLPWEEFHETAEDGNKKALFNDDLDDDRVNENKVIFSGDLRLSKELVKKYFDEITLKNERDVFLNDNTYFVIFESKHLKTPSQYLIHGPDHSVIWRDVCLFNSKYITFRSLTTDKSFKPRVIIQDNPDWVLSNDMPNISNQAMKAFIEFAHPSMMINKR